MAEIETDRLKIKYGETIVIPELSIALQSGAVTALMGANGSQLSAQDRSAIDWALTTTQLEPLAARSVDMLSGGERQRAWIAMALAQQTRILLLDEPTTDVDIRHQHDILLLVRRLNREQGITVVWVLHDLNQAAIFRAC